MTRFVVGGAETNALESAARLDPTRFDPLLVFGSDAETREGSLLVEAEERGVDVAQIPTMTWGGSWRDHARATRDLSALIRRFRPDVVHTGTILAGFLGRLAATRMGVPVVVHTVHGWEFGRHETKRALAARIAGEVWCAARTDRLLTVSSVERDVGLALRIGEPSQYEVVYSGVDLDSFRRADRSRAGRSSTRRRVLGIGRQMELKDPLTFVRVARRVVDQIGPTDFAWVGGGPMEEAVRSEIGRLGLVDDVRLLGVRRDVPELLGGSDVLLQTSRSEAFGRTVCEAMAAGVPVVATRVGGHVEQIAHDANGLLADPGDVPGLAAAVVRLLVDGELRQRLVAAGRRSVDRYSIDAMIHRLESIYLAEAAHKGLRGFQQTDATPRRAGVA